MPDHRIGITLDVKRNQEMNRLQSDFKDIGKSAENMQRQFKNIDNISEILSRGVGSKQYTEELQKQLRMMQQMDTLRRRWNRNGGGNTGSPGGGGSGSDSGFNPGSGAGPGGGGNNSRPSMANIGKNMLGLGAAGLAAYAGYKGLNLLHSGYNANLQMLPTFANMGQTMAPNGGNMAWAQSMLRAGQGFGYDNAAILAGAQTIQAAAGQSNNFFGQIRGVAQFGRYNGFDYGQAANYFSNAYQSGVVGGNQAQMSWQQYAILVANTVNAGNMQGRNGQVVNALQQLTQMAQTSTVNAPNQQQVAQIYATGTKSGNQALTNQLPNIIQGVNQGIMNPGWGPYGRAAMQQAVAPGAGTWHAQMLMSEGAFGTGDNGKTNFQNVLTYASRMFGGNSDQAAVMAGNWLGISPSQAKTMLQTYLPNGRWNNTAWGKNQSALKKQLDSPNSSSLDQSQNNMTVPGQTAQGMSAYAVGPLSSLYKGVLGDPVGLLAMGGLGAVIGSKMFGYARGFFKGAPRGTLTPPPSPIVSGAGESSGIIYGADGQILSRVPLGEAGAGTGAGLAGMSAVGTGALGAVSAVGTVMAGDSLGDAVSDFLFGHYKGETRAGLFNPTHYTDTVKPGWEKLLFGNGDSSKAKVTTSDKRQGVSYADFNANKAATETAAILMALRPWAKQIDQWYGGTASGSSGMKNTNTSFTPNSNQSSALNSGVSVGPGMTNTSTPGGGNWLSNLLGGAGSKVGQFIASVTGDSYTGVNQYLNLINSISSKDKVPAQVLAGIMQDESGGNPYSINDNSTGKQYSFKSMQEYLNEAKALSGDSLDLGLMQINNRAHPDVSAQQAADPNFAINYAANMLQSAYQHGGNWDYAIQSYNPGDPSYVPKIKKVEASLLGSSYSNGSGKVSVNVNAPKTINVQLQQNGQNVGNALIPLTTQASYNGLG